MIDATAFPLDAITKSTRAAWAGKPHAGYFITRRITGAIIRTQPSLGVLAAVLCAASGVGLLALALLGARGVM